MAFGKIPRFSPSFSPSEAMIAFRYLLQDGPNDDVVRNFESKFAQYIGAKHAVMVPSAVMGPVELSGFDIEMLPELSTVRTSVKVT